MDNLSRVCPVCQTSSENAKLFLKQNIDTIEIVDGSILDYVQDESKTKEITGYSLSDFCSYAPDDFYSSVWENIVKNSQNGTKFCERQYLVKQNPEKLFSEIKTT